jgi:hypothetical protein
MLAAAERFPGGTSSLGSCLLNIPTSDVQQIKAKCVFWGWGWGWG